MCGSCELPDHAVPVMGVFTVPTEDGGRFLWSRSTGDKADAEILLAFLLNVTIPALRRRINNKIAEEYEFACEAQMFIDLLEVPKEL